MDSNIIFYGLIYFSILGFLWIIRYIINKIFLYLDRKNELKELEIKNNQFNLYLSMDPKLAEEEIDNLVEKYLDEYVLNKILINNIDFIRKDQIEEMVKCLDKNIMLEISELYIFYIKTLVNIKDQDDLLKYINKKVKEHVLTFVTQFNKPKNEIK